MVKIADIIKYEGDNSTFVWKHPREDFNTATIFLLTFYGAKKKVPCLWHLLVYSNIFYDSHALSS